MPLCAGKAAALQRSQNLRRRRAGLDAVPVVAPHARRVCLGAAQPCQRWHPAAHIALEQRGAEGTLRLGDFQDADASTRPQHTVELAERRFHIGHMAQRIAHADEIHAGIGHRQLFGLALEQAHLVQQRAGLHHGRARIHAGHQRRIAHDADRLGRHQPGAEAHIQHLHAALQPGALQRLAAVAGAGAESQHAFHPVVVRGCAVENAAQETGALLLAAIVLGQRGMRLMHGFGGGGRCVVGLGHGKGNRGQGNGTPYHG